MPQFMKGFFDKAFFIVFRNIHGRESFFEPKCRYDTCSSGELRLTVDMRQDRNKKIDIGNCDDFDVLSR